MFMFSTLITAFEMGIGTQYCSD